ncbi:hypothetical protein TNCV_2096761 [Trichonephila clavipes]|nr:hypothetical protein TNCV_2096761 [Trichonephila clavipes]
MNCRKVLRPDEIADLLREFSENESEGDELSYSKADSYEDIHWCAKTKDEVEKLAYQLNEEAERKKGQSGD